MPRAMCDGDALAPMSDQVGGISMNPNSPREGLYSTGD